MIAVLIILLVFMVRLFSKTKRPFRNLLLNLASGLGILVLLNLTGSFTHIELGYNLTTLGISSVLGVPGVTGLLLLKAMWGIV